MKLEYNPRNFLRFVPVPLLQDYFEQRQQLQDIGWEVGHRLRPSQLALPLLRGGGTYLRSFLRSTYASRSGTTVRGTQFKSGGACAQTV